MNGELNDLVKAAKEAKGVFKELGPVEIVGCVTCNGYQGTRIMDAAKLLSKWGADIIAFSAGGIGTADGDDVNRCNERILKQLAEQLKSTIIIDYRNGTGV